MSATQTPVLLPYEALKIYEKAVYQRLPNSNEALFTMVESLMLSTNTTGLMTAGAPTDVLRALYTRFAAAMTTQALTPGFGLNNVEFYWLCNNKIVIEAAFALSGFADAQHLLDYLLETDSEGHTVLRESTVFLTCLFFSLDNIPDQIFDAALALPGIVLLPLTLGWLSSHRVLTVEGEARRARLIESHEQLRQTALPIEMVRSVSHAWMYCTYSDTSQRHQIKQTLNELIVGLSVREGATPRAVTRRIVDKPRLLVAAERWRSNHAMFRCYGPSIERLRERFHVSLVADQKEFDAKSAAQFDEVQGLQQEGIKIRDILAPIIRMKPDLIYYPSLGMSAWTLVSANFRLAPIQFMSAGHPATSMSEHMDYMMLSERGAEGAESVRETVIVQRGDALFDQHPELPEVLPETETPDDGYLHLAVHGAGMKISARFLSTCRHLIENAHRSLHFHFFPGAPGVGMDDLRIRLPQILHGAAVTVHPYMSYLDLLKALGRCRLALAPYPFGNTNSTTDTCLMSVPTVCYRAPHIHCLGDKIVIQAAGLPEWLLTTNDEEYRTLALRLIRDDAFREGLVEQMKALKIRERLFSPAEDRSPEAFLEATWWMYRNHEAIQKSGRQCVRVGEDLPTG